MSKMICPKCGEKITIPDTISDVAKKGGLTKTDAKSAAARENGKKGGRPKKEK